MRVLVVILNYRSAPYTIDCLRELAPQIAGREDVQIVVTDNASGDGSVEALEAFIAREKLGERVRVMPLPRNGGYSYGNNAAIRPALAGANRPQYVWLLNPDTLPRAGALDGLLDFLDARPDVSIAGSRLEYADGTHHHSRFRFLSFLSELETAARLKAVSWLLQRHAVAPPLTLQPHPIDWVVGASIMIRSDVFDAIGLFDEDFFLYFEEVDFCLRARRAGFNCWYVPQSRVAHLVGRASGITNEQEPQKRRPRYWFESRRRYFVKNHGRLYALATDAAFALAFGGWRARRALLGKADDDPPRFLGDFVRFNFLGRYDES